jgi:hypothetical protein
MGSPDRRSIPDAPGSRALIWDALLRLRQLALRHRAKLIDAPDRTARVGVDDQAEKL